jgi:hypothetical protein
VGKEGELERKYSRCTPFLIGKASKNELLLSSDSIERSPKDEVRGTSYTNESTPALALKGETPSLTLAENAAK